MEKNAQHSKFIWGVGEETIMEVTIKSKLETL